MMHCAETQGLFARWLFCLLRVSDFKRPKYEVNRSYIMMMCPSVLENLQTKTHWI